MTVLIVKESRRLEDFIQRRARIHRKGNIMPKDFGSISIEQLLAEADELIRQINSEVINDIQEAHRLQFEKHAQNLKKIKSEVQGKIEKEYSIFISVSILLIRLHLTSLSPVIYESCYFTSILITLRESR